MTLSFSKTLSLTFIAFSAIPYYERENSYYLSFVNPDIRTNYSKTQYLNRLSSTFYFTPLLTVSILIYLPIVLLLLYPFKFFCKLLSYCGPQKYHAIYVFLDTFQGHYKDGTNGTRDYRAASCISFILRIPVYYLLTISNSYRFSNVVQKKSSLEYCFILTSLFYGVIRPCKTEVHE